MLKVNGPGQVTFVKEPHRAFPPRVHTGKVVIGSAWVPRPRPLNSDTDAFAQAVMLGYHKTQPKGRIGRALRDMEII